MTPNQFVTWFKGFSEACHHLNPTPQQWDHILKTLKEVKEDVKECTCGQKTYTYPYSTDIGGIPSTIENKKTSMSNSKQQLND